MKKFELHELLRDFLIAMLIWFMFLFVFMTLIDMACTSQQEDECNQHEEETK
jgi:hypothetical protein